jgi:DAPG hydrolase PhiG domain
MRSRFWMGGAHCAIRTRYAPGVAARAVRPIASRVLGAPESAARDLLVHCAQEMNHLARFLPELSREFGDE